MKFNKIISSALLVVMIFTTLFAAMPINAFAAHSDFASSSSARVPEGYEEAKLNSEELAKYLNSYLASNFSSAAEMLKSELEAGYLYYVNSTDGKYTLYVNKYTGFVYYVNTVTGQILTSNPINPGYKNNNAFAVSPENRDLLMSQISVNYSKVSDSSQSSTLNSFIWAAQRSQISVNAILGGIRVNYTIGDTTARFLLPGMARAEHFENKIVLPMLEEYAALVETICAEKYPDKNFSFIGNDEYTQYTDGCINYGSGKKMGVSAYLSDMLALAKKSASSSDSKMKELSELNKNINLVTKNYTLNNPELYDPDDARDKITLEKMYKAYPITKEGYAVYVYSGFNLADTKRPLHNIIKELCTSYTYSEMFAEEKICGYVDTSAQQPVFRCALEYVFNEDGSLSVRLPASSITFDETVFILNSITPLAQFGAGDMTEEGYIFYPDGSGAIVDFDDFYNPANNTVVALVQSGSVYGTDYCYSKITGARMQQITMPVFGLVNKVKASDATYQITGSDTVTNGFFAVIEEGASLATLNYTTGGALYRYASAYASYNPYPSDTFSLSGTISVGSSGTFTIVSESKYTGSYVTRYVMLTDEKLASKIKASNPEFEYYAADYVGMSSYYKNFLREEGVLTALTDYVENELPLYIEVLGAMDITARILSFPVTKTIPLTTFDNVSTMYEEFSKCEEYVVTKYEEFKSLAEKEKDENQKYQYQKQAERYEELIGEISNIKNINFKLTGFANGGMSSTYPNRVKWESVCGGKRGFKALVKEAGKISLDAGSNFSLFPDFDFIYINNTAAFDGINKKLHASKQVDNRYANKQIFNSVHQIYESFFTLVANPDQIDNLYAKFAKKYSKYNVGGISAATLGSDLNSNFDEKMPINREEALDTVVSVLDNMKNKHGNEIMLDKGNAYTLEYATHILNAAIDSSHSRYASRTVPFVGLVLHGYVNYTGSAINYAGAPAYDILRSIENGASLYYVLCYQNTSYMKDDPTLNDYYSVDYHTWYDSVLTTYKQLNEAIGDLQGYEITDHSTIIAERKIDDREMQENYRILKDEIIELLDAQLLQAVDATLASLKGNSQNYDKRVRLSISATEREALLTKFSEILNISEDELKAKEGNNPSFFDSVNALIDRYEAEYKGTVGVNDTVDMDKTVMVVVPEFRYESKYSFVTDSNGDDENYVSTKFTVDDASVVMVTYKSGDTVKRFILNYNNFSVTVKLSDVEKPISLDAYAYERID